MMEDLTNYQQQSLDTFLSVTNNNSKTSSCSGDFRSFLETRRLSNFTKDPYILSHPIYQISLAYRKSFVPCTIHEAISDICTKKLSSELTLSVDNIISNNSSRSSTNVDDSISQMTLDRDAVLLAVSNSLGLIRIYDIDEMQYAMQYNNKYQRDSR